MQISVLGVGGVALGVGPYPVDPYPKKEIKNHPAPNRVACERFMTKSDFCPM
jgi:hypothetical protein